MDEYDELFGNLELQDDDPYAILDVDTDDPYKILNADTKDLYSVLDDNSISAPTTTSDLKERIDNTPWYESMVYELEKKKHEIALD